MWRVLCAAVVSSASLIAQSAGPRIGPRDVAILMASRQMPAGVIAPTVVMSVGPPPPPSPASETDDGLLARFTASLPSFDAVRDGTVVHVLPKDLPSKIRARLDQKLELESTSDTSATGMVIRFADALRGRISPNALAGGGLPGPKCPLANTVHLPDTPMPWHEGNSALAGHRDTFFRPLQHIRVGDELRVSTARGELRYRVTEVMVVGPTDVWVLDRTDRPTLTLITCYPFRYIGNAPRRFVVRADRTTMVEAKGS